ncbi:hypothetical protein ABBQ32_008487 [Trebouxia sp. C0010 RCD-2024]
MSSIKQPEVWNPQVKFEFFVDNSPARRRRGGSMRFASATAALSESVLNSQSASLSAPPPPSPPKVDTKPASDVLAGAMARAASQGTIHPLDTLKVRMQSQSTTAAKRPLSKIAKLIPPAGADAAATAAKAQKAVTKAIPKVASLYKGVIGAASGAGIAIGTYFAFYGAASNMLSTSTTLAPGQIAFVAGGMAAAGGSVVKVPLAVCIRSVQAGVYPNVFKAAGAITDAAGVRGLFTGYLPTLLEDVPDMAFKFAAYETLRQVHRRLNDRKANVQEDFAMGACAGAFAAAATTPLDVIKTNMMCTAASRPTMLSAGRAVLAQGGPKYFFRGVGARALSNGINSAVFFCFFEALRATFAQKKQEARRKAVVAARNRAGTPMLLSRHKGPASDVKLGKNMRPATAALAAGPALELS